MARRISEETPLSTIRAMLLWTLLASTAGTLLELLLIGHDEMITQWAPLVLLGLGLAASVSALIAPHAATVRVLQVLMVAFVGSGIVGVGLHYQGNEVFELEMHPSSSGMTLVAETLTGATPVLAPASMSLLGVLGLAFTYRHPLLRRHAAVASSQEAQP
jgi:hypothetical protein